MAKSIRVSTKRRGRPKTTGKGELIGVRILPPLLKRLDAWIAGQVPRPSRPEAIRRFVERALPTSSEHGSTSKHKANKASDLANRAADHFLDKSVPPEEQERRKRTLIKGPKEFRDIREDLPKGTAKT
jgi:hypothetical protein